MSGRTVEARRSTARGHVPFGVAGALCVIAGGLVAAATAPSPSELGSWSAAYLVLVGGVAQLALAAGQLLLGGRRAARGLLALEWGLWNLGNLVVIGGTVLGSRAVVAIGGVLLVAALVGFVYGTAEGRADTAAAWRWGYRAFAVFMLVSVAVGTFLAG